MKEIQISEREYNILTQHLELFDTMRNNLLAFSFTSVLTVLGIAIAMDIWNYVGLIAPIFLIVIVHIIADSTYSYKKLMDDFSNEILVSW